MGIVVWFALGPLISRDCGPFRWCCVACESESAVDPFVVVAVSSYCLLGLADVFFDLTLPWLVVLFLQAKVIEQLE